MAAQFDFIAGLDISSLSSVTQAQLMQMINQIAPLSNIGGVIFQAGTNTNPHIDEGAQGSPSVTDNPRFARYIWLNTHNAATAAPTPYYYNADTEEWRSTSVAAGSIDNASIASNADIEVTKLLHGSASQVLRTNSAATAVEFTDPSNIFSNNQLDVVKLTSSSDSYLKCANGVTSWVGTSTERQNIQNAISGLNVQQLSAGAQLSILRTNSIGLVAWDLPSAAFGAGSNIPISALAAGGATDRQLMQYNGSSWAPVTTSLHVNSTALISIFGTLGGSAAISVHTVSHSLNALPKLVRVVLVCNTADSTFLQNDEVDASAFVIDTGTTFLNAVSVTVRSTTQIIVAINQTASFKVVNSTGNYVTVTRSSWTVKVYAWA